MATAKLSLSVSAVTNDNTTYTVKAVLYYYGNGKSHNGYQRSWTISATGQNSRSGTHSFTTSTSAQYLGEASFSWSKGASSASKTISASFSTGVSLGTLTTSTSITVPAKPYYTVTYANVNNAGSTTTRSVQYGTYHSLITPPAITNYKFDGWKNSSGTTYSAGTSVQITGNVTYTASWSLDVVKIEFGEYSVEQTVNSKITSTLTTNLDTYISNFNIDDTVLNGIYVSGTNTLIAKVKKANNKYALDTFAESDYFKKDSSGNINYVGAAGTLALEYSYTYLKHNLNKYHINSNNSIQSKTYNDVAGTKVDFNYTLEDLQGYKHSRYYKKVNQPPTKLTDFILSDIFVNNVSQYAQYGYVNSATIQKTDTYYTSVYVSNSNLITQLESYDAVRTTTDKLNNFIRGDINEYISEDNSLNYEVKDDSGTLICGYVKYKSPYANGDEFVNLNGEKLIANKGLIGDYVIRVNEEILQYNIIFIDDDIYIKFWGVDEYQSSDFYYVTAVPNNITNDLNYPLDNTPISIFIPSDTVVMDVNKAKNIIAFGIEAPDDIIEELVLFNRPITFIKNGVKYQQFIISHPINIVNISSGKYIVTVDNCTLSIKDINNTEYTLNLQKYDIIDILKTPNLNNISLNITLNRGSKSIIYKTILI